LANYTPGPVDRVDPPSETAPPFRATLYRLEGVNFAVDAPIEVSDWFGGRGPIPVLGRLDRITVRATLVPAGGGRHRVYLNGPMREALGLGEGDDVDVVLWSDPDSRDPSLPEDLHEALTAAGALDAWNAWAPSHRLEYLRAIESAKRPETRAKYIERTVAAAAHRR
jgi:hypothetical protein